MDWWRNVPTKPSNFKPYHNLDWPPQEFSFCLPKPTPSSPDIRCTRIFCSQDVHHHHMMAGLQIFLFHNIHPHHVMTGPQEFLVWEGLPLSQTTDTQELFVPQHPPASRDDRCTRIFVPKRSTWHRMMIGSQEFLVQEGLPSLFTSSIVLHTEPDVFQCCQAVMSLEITIWHDEQNTVYEKKYPCKKWWPKPLEAKEVRCCWWQ